MHRILYILLLGLIFLIALLFSVQNLDLVKVYFYRGVGKELAVELPLVVVMTLELFAGAVIGYSVQVLRNLKLKSEITRLKKQISSAATDQAHPQ